MGQALSLLVAGSLDTGENIQQALTVRFSQLNLHRVDNREHLSQALGSSNYDLLLSEMELVDFSANDIPDIIEQHQIHLPIGLLSRANDRIIAKSCLEHIACQLMQFDEPYIRFLPDSIEALLRRDRSLLQLQETEQRFIDVFNNTSDLIQCIDQEGKFLYTNNTWRKAMGYTEDEIGQLNLMDVIHPECIATCSTRFEKLKQGGSLPTIDFKFKTKKGKTLHMIGDCGAVVKDGTVLSTRGIFRNVTHTVQVEQALKESEARYQSLYDHAPDICTTLNVDGTILSVNWTGLKMLGYSRDELVGHTAVRVVHPEDQHRVIDYMRLFIEGYYESQNNDPGNNEYQDIEYRMLKSDGSFIWVHQRVTREVNEKGDVLHVICRDITLRRELQDKLTYHATHDALTNLINRRELETRLQRVLSTSDEPGQHVLCFLDLDEFKKINDDNGHAAGDELLRQVTRILRGQMRSRDTLARIGGDEFVILMEHCPLPTAERLLNKIVNMISEYEFKWRAQTFSIGVSIGVSPLRDTSIDEMISIVDDACYRAKRNGKHCVYVDNAEQTGS